MNIRLHKRRCLLFPPVKHIADSLKNSFLANQRARNASHEVKRLHLRRKFRLERYRQVPCVRKSDGVPRASRNGLTFGGLMPVLSVMCVNIL